MHCNFSSGCIYKLGHFLICWHILGFLRYWDTLVISSLHRTAWFVLQTYSYLAVWGEQSCAVSASLSSTPSQPIPTLEQNQYLLFICACNIVLHDTLWEALGCFSFLFHFDYSEERSEEDSVIQLHLHVYFISKYPLDFHIFISLPAFSQEKVIHAPHASIECGKKINQRALLF